MDSKNIEQLLEKYWNCETSLEEELQLRDYFLGEDVPAQWKETAELFRYFDKEKATRMVGGSEDSMFVTSNGSKQRGKTAQLIYNYGRIAAGLLVVVTATVLVRQEIRKSYPPEVADTYSDPKLAFEETKKALMMISGGFGKARKETTKINLFNEAEKKIQGKKEVDKKEKVII